MVTCNQEAFAALERKLIEEKARLQKEAESQVMLAAALITMAIALAVTRCRCARSLKKATKRCTRSWTRQPKGSSFRTGDVL